jgi:hypothetical protein
LQNSTKARESPHWAAETSNSSATSFEFKGKVLVGLSIIDTVCFMAVLSLILRATIPHKTDNVGVSEGYPAVPLRDHVLTRIASAYPSPQILMVVGCPIILQDH